MAEELVAARLIAHGYEIVARNARVGRLELDIIARRGRLLVVCEVRSRASDLYGSPLETITKAKTANIRRATAGWMRREKPSTKEVRFDAAAVTFGGPGGEPIVEYYEDAF